MPRRERCSSASSTSATTSACCPSSTIQSSAGSWATSLRPSPTSASSTPPEISLDAAAPPSTEKRIEGSRLPSERERPSRAALALPEKRIPLLSPDLEAAEMELHGFAAGLPREAVHRQLARSAGVSQPSHASPATARPQTLAAFSSGRRPFSSLRRSVRRTVPKSMSSFIAGGGRDDPSGSSLSEAAIFPGKAGKAASRVAPRRGQQEGGSDPSHQLRQRFIEQTGRYGLEHLIVEPGAQHAIAREGMPGDGQDGHGRLG